MYIVIGLGNPGRNYVNTRHNVGFEAVDLLAQKHNVSLNKLKFHAVFGDFKLGNEKVMLVKPQTYMNRSGISVFDIVNFYKVPIENVIVIYDDVDLELGTLRIRARGSSGTHNGMKSVIYQIQSDDFPRIRIGIGKNPGINLADFVLQKFNSNEREIVNEVMITAVESVEDIIINNVDSAMNKFNKKTRNE